ncbi:MAG: DUF2059 domain-containing protein [Marivibrio sp.]|uniref:DUF2059 domain-containing protein n=1 Tax=Marivibrio sp. TaxID=2039719 RepID=UPI0032EB90B3
MPTSRIRSLKHLCAAGVAALALTAAPAVAQQAADSQGAQAQGQQQQQVQVSPEKLRKIERLLDLTRVERTVETMAPMASQQMGKMLEKRAPKMGEQQRARLIQTAADTFRAGRDELTEALIPIYAQTFTMEELDHMLAFYDSPTGQSISQKLPQAVGAARQISRQWSQQMAQQAMAEVRDEAADMGYKL